MTYMSRKPQMTSMYKSEAYVLLEVLARNASDWGWQPLVEAIVPDDLTLKRRLNFLVKIGLINIKIEKPLADSSLKRTWVTFTEQGKSLLYEKYNINFPKLKGD